MRDEEQIDFRSLLLSWFTEYRRDLPWRRTRDPYAIWISEIMLQQTRVATVIPYYERFLTRFPTAEVLANAPESELLAHWAGLGYYYRARNLQKAARQIVAAGEFPSTYKQISELPGIGDYTAAAVGSIGFNLPHAVLDGNVFRVLSRVFNDNTNIALGSSRKRFGALAEKLLDRTRPGDWNQAMMELGATICLPKKPQCLLCPVTVYCQARAENRQDQLPVKVNPTKSTEEKRILFWIEKDEKVVFWQRSANTRLMPGFWELPEQIHLPAIADERKLGSFRHGITTHNYSFEVREAFISEAPAECKWLAKSDLSFLPISTVARKAERIVRQSRQRQALAKSAVSSTQ